MPHHIYCKYAIYRHPQVSLITFRPVMFLVLFFFSSTVMIQGPSITRESKQAGCKVVGKDLDIGTPGHAGKTLSKGIY